MCLRKDAVDERKVDHAGEPDWKEEKTELRGREGHIIAEDEDPTGPGYGDDETVDNGKRVTKQ